MQGMTMQEFAAELQRRHEARRDFVMSSELLTVSVDGSGRTGVPLINFQLEDNEVSSLLSRHARGQLAERTGMPKRFMDRLLDKREYHEDLTSLLNNIMHTEPKQTLVRMLDGDTRALLSDRYRRIDNLDIMSAVMPVLAEHKDMQVRAQNLSENYMHFQVFFPQLRADVGVGDTVTAGLTITNSETGTSSFKVELGIFRLVCANGLIVNTGMKRHHVGARIGGAEPVELYSDETLAADDEAMMLKVRDIVAASLDEAQFLLHVDQAKDALGMEVARPVKTVQEVTKRLGISDGQERVLELLLDSSVAGVPEAGRTMWGVINALTAFAKEQEFTKAIELERAAGNLLAAPKQLLELAEAA